MPLPAPSPESTTAPEKEDCAQIPPSRILALEKSKSVRAEEIRRTIAQIKGLLRALEQQLLALEK